MPQRKLAERSQSAIDYLLLTGVITILVIPVFYAAMSRLDSMRETQVSDATQTLKETADTLISHLRNGSATREIIQLPKGIQSFMMTKKILVVYIKDEPISVEFEREIAGTFPVSEGRHYVNMYNNGTSIILYECGNNQREAFEQCDRTSADNCGTGVCTSPALDLNGCKCACTSYADCPYGTTCINNICQASEWFCGNGIQEGSEECDDGNQDKADQCNQCILTSCQDGTRQNPNGYGEFEECDTDGAVCGAGGVCLPDCTCTGGASGTCGDNVADPSLGEECDGTDDYACPGLCQADCTCQANLCPAELISYWPLDDAQGTSAYDASDGNPGTLRGSPQWVNGQVNAALQFDGSSATIDYVEIPHKSNLGLGTSSFSIAAGIRTATTRSYSPGIVSKFDPVSANRYYQLDIDQGSSAFGPRIRISGSLGAFSLSHTVDLRDNQFHHIVAVRDVPNRVLKLYLDGQLVKTSAPNSFVAQDIGSTAKLYLGIKTASLGSSEFEGIIDEVAIYNKVLTPTEITTMYEEFSQSRNYCTITPPAVCNGDGICEPGENCNNCFMDCDLPDGACCGDGNRQGSEQCDGDINVQCAAGTACVNCMCV